MKEQAKKWNLQYDVLRIIAAFSVVVLHVSAQFWYGLEVTDSKWLVANGYDAIVRFGVPVFVMISGALFLDPQKEISLKKLILHNVLRILVLYIIWSIVYGLWDITFYQESPTLYDYVVEMTTGRYQLWFLKMLAGVYLLVPILRRWLKAASKKEVEYFLVLFFIFQIIRQTGYAIFNNVYTNFVFGLFDLQMVCSYLGYFVLGYYIVTFGVSDKLKKVLYISGVFGAFLNITGSTFLSIRAGQAKGDFYDSFSIGTFLFSAALFVFITSKQQLKQQKKSVSSSLIRELSQDTLGVYMMHIGLLEFLQGKGINNSIIPPIFGIPLLAIVCFIICTVVAALLRRIPLIGKYLC